MFELRPLSPSAIPAALAKAERYRLLNDSGQAESICQDVLAIDPDNQDALAMMILAITDQFRDEGTAAHVGRAERLVPGLRDPYTQAYYGAIINERRARAALDAGRATMAYEWLLGALHGFDRAIGLRPAGNDDAVLRWNTCARVLNAHPYLAPRGEQEYEPVLDD
jgi:hypothetical protein